VIGGIIIRVGDKLIDGSIRSKLAALRKELGGAGR
jgi:F0F1-type ATP synthase delta subunit